MIQVLLWIKNQGSRMSEINLPLELISNLISIIVIIAIVIRFINYKKKVSVIDGLYELQEEKKLTEADIDFIKTNINEYKDKAIKQEAFNKLIYPVFIFIVGVFFLYLEFQEAMIHTNIVVVAFIYVTIKKVHYNNYIKLLSDIKI